MTTKRQRDERKLRYSDFKRRLDEHDAKAPSKAYKLPENIKRLEFDKEADLSLDIIPYRTKNNPFADPGDLHYELTYHVHRRLGPNFEDHCCLRQTFGEECPICNKAFELNQDPETKAIAKGLWPQQRQLWIVRNRKKKDAGLFILDLPYYGKGQGFGETIQNKLDAVRHKKNHPYHTFYHLDGGCKLNVAVREDSFPTGDGKVIKFFRTTDIELVRRKEALPTSLLKRAPCLEDLLVKPKASLLEKLMHGTIGGGKKTSKKVDDNDIADEGGCPAEIGDTVTFEYKGKQLTGEVTKINEDKELLTVEVDGRDHPCILNWDDDTISVVDPEDDDADSPRAAKKSSKKKPTRKSRDDDEEDEDDIEDDEDEDESDDDDEEEESDDEDEDEDSDDDDSDDDDDGDDDGDEKEDDEDDDDDPPARKKSKPKPKSKPTKKKRVEEEEDDDSDDEDSDDDDSDDEDSDDDDEPLEDDEDEDEDEDSDDEDEPRRGKKPSKKKRR